MQRRKIGSLCLQEIRWKGQGARELGEGYKLLYSGGTDKKYGVGVILDQEMKEKVVDVTRHSNRLMAVRLVIQGQVYNIVSGYVRRRKRIHSMRIWRRLSETYQRQSIW